MDKEINKQILISIYCLKTGRRHIPDSTIRLMTGVNKELYSKYIKELENEETISYIKDYINRKE